jgi:integrase
VARSHRRKARRRHVGKVSLYQHHGSWWIYYREAGRQVRKPVAQDETAAEQAAAQVNAQLTCGAPSLFSFQPTTVAGLQREFLAHHEFVLRSSLATVSRYRTATQHLVAFSQTGQRSLPAHEVHAGAFARYLRELRVAPNGHPNSAARPLRDKGVRYILETCRAMFGFAARQRRMPPYADNPFAGLGGKRIKIEDAKRVFVFDERQELAFFAQAHAWAVPIHFTLAKTGMRSGELAHLLIEDLDLDAGWLQIRNRPELGWRVKTRRERQIPLIDELVLVLRRLIGERRAGPVFVRVTVSADRAPLWNRPAAALSQAVELRLKTAGDGFDGTRGAMARLQRKIWRDAGATLPDAIRLSFIKIATAAGLEGASCPKSWRHTFATLLQDANVDPLIRQVTLGHSPAVGLEGALGMTSLYTHTRPETQKREILRALQLWPKLLQFAHRSLE